MGMDQTPATHANSLPVMSTQEKALAINLDAATFGTFAEIGAGQEVARWFFHVGHASATVAKSMSAYDMVISDIIYGAADHYVSRARLESMLDHEWTQLLERLDPVRGERTWLFRLCRHRRHAQPHAQSDGTRLDGRALPSRTQGALFADHDSRQSA